MTYFLIPIAALILLPLTTITRARFTQATHFYLMLLFFLLVLAVKLDSDDDYASYESVYDSVPLLWQLSWVKLAMLPMENGYLVFNSFIKTVFGLSSEVFIASFCVASFAIKAVFVRRVSLTPFASLIIYASIYFYNNDYIQFRWGFAAGLMVWAIYSYLNGRNILALITFLIGCSFHVTSISLLVVFLIYRLIYYRSQKALVFILFFSFLLSFVDITDFIVAQPLFIGDFNYFIIKLNGYLARESESTLLFRFLLFAQSIGLCALSAQAGRSIDKQYVKVAVSIAILALVTSSFAIYSGRISVVYQLVFSVVFVNLLASYFRQRDKLLAGSLVLQGILAVYVILFFYLTYSVIQSGHLYTDTLDLS